MTMNVIHREAHCAWQAHADLGEGPLWVAEHDALYWVDILSARIFRYFPALATAEVCAMPFATTSIALTTDGHLLCTGPRTICLLDTHSGQLSEVWQLPGDMQGVRINDGYCHPNGDFWFGTMDLQESAPFGDFYRFRASGACERVPAAFAITNGPAFTHDGTVGYFVDTLGRRILQARLTEGALAEPWRSFVRIPEGDGYPDGLALDADGGVWCSHWAGNRVTRFDPDGRTTDVVHLPVSNATKCAFGGERLDRLYITTARKGLRDDALLTQPLAGSLFEVEVGYRGVSPPSFCGAFPAGIPLGGCHFTTAHQ